jgi:DeoR family suf operon transcriptional repressor
VPVAGDTGLESKAVQATRERILTILKERHQATVDGLSQELGLTAVTVRHHLEILRGEGLVAAPLTEKASAVFPKRYDELTAQILREVRLHLSPAEMDQMMKHIGERIASRAALPDGADFAARLAATVEFLDELGYMARWEQADGGDYLLHVANCPYERVASQNHEICTIDLTLLTCLLGVSPQRISWAAQGDDACIYTICPPTA